MDVTDYYAVFHIRADMRANKEPLGRNDRKRTSEVAALQRSVRELNARVDNFPDNRSKDDRFCGQYPDESDSRSNKNQPGIFASLTLRRSIKALVIDFPLPRGLLLP